ncbi:MAG: hypothetical protein B6U88_02490 [Candidatus Aenigmarchaeota archaeon ex4484_56]|nr:MAG: hypothetical protein B6U88_02490 [Candidatus Aenigmarchaeota archaeon ex4484_56]
MSERILVICIDRDNDVGEKLNVEGPILGRNKNLEIAKNLSLVDPEESDANCIYGAIKEYDDLKKQGKDVYIVTLLGDKNVGIISDEKIEKQFNEVIKKYRPEKAVFVSDGAEDEFVIPIIQSKVPIMSLKRIIVKQSLQLESGYYMIIKFLKEIMNDPQTSKLVFGIPAIIFILYAIFGGVAGRIIIGVIGIYLIIKGFHLEDSVSSSLNELYSTLLKNKISFFCYIVGFAFAVVGLVQGYDLSTLYANSNFLIVSLSFIEGGLIYYLISGLCIITGKFIYVETKKIHYLTYYGLLFSIYLVLENSIKYIIYTDYNVIYLATSIAIGFLVLTISLIVEKISNIAK